MKKEIWKPPPNWLGLFAENLKLERNFRNLSQREFGEIFEIDAATVTYWEKGKSFPRLPLLIKICEYFGRSPNEMLTEQLDKNKNGGGGRASPPLSRDSDTGAGTESDTELKQKLQELEQRLQKLEQLELLQAH